MNNNLVNEKLHFIFQATSLKCIEQLSKDKKRDIPDLEGKEAFLFLMNDPKLTKEYCFTLLLELQKIVFNEEEAIQLREEFLASLFSLN